VTSETNLAGREFKRILLIKLSAFGDVIHTIALLNALRRRYPDAQIDWLLKPSVAALIRHHPAVSNVLIYGENQTEVPQYNWAGFTHWLRLMRDHRFLGLLRKLKSARYDLVIDVHGQMRTGFVTLVAGAPVRIGFERPRREVWEKAGKSLPPGTIERAWRGSRERAWVAYTHPIPIVSLDIHAVDRYLLLGQMLGFSGPASFHMPLPREARQRVEELWLANGWQPSAAPIVISPAALWETKRWLPGGFAAVARHYMAAGHPVVLIGADNERGECAYIATQAPGVVDLAGQTTLIELAALVQRSALCLTNDSGPMHLAAALGRPVVAVFGPTNPRWVGPYGQDDAVVKAGSACSPCYLRDLSRCPHDHQCMTAITPAAVIARMDATLRAPPSLANASALT
jgi:heptosyltransferase I